MASYMYTSASGSNWDDDEDDFSLEVYQAAANVSASTSVRDELPPAPTTEGQDEEPSASTVSSIFDDYFDQDDLPTYAQKVTHSWYCPDLRPAYVELSHQDGYAYPEERVRYSSNWTATKLRMGANLRMPMMMKPSPLKLSMTWKDDSQGDFIQHRGLMFPSLPLPVMAYDSSSEEERDEAQTPPGSPPKVQATMYKGHVEEYDPVTGIIDVPAHSTEADDSYLSSGFGDFSRIAADSSVEDVLSDVATRIQHNYVNESIEQGGLTSEPTMVGVDTEASSVTEHGQSFEVESCTPPGSPARRNVTEDHHEPYGTSSTVIAHECLHCEVPPVAVTHTAAAHLDDQIESPATDYIPSEHAADYDNVVSEASTSLRMTAISPPDTRLKAYTQYQSSQHQQPAPKIPSNTASKAKQSIPDPAITASTPTTTPTTTTPPTMSGERKYQRRFLGGGGRKGPTTKPTNGGLLCAIACFLRCLSCVSN
ncbi:hypothetical protein C7974DRAFT_417674 [Boeremia exigua]|uniref:uncharacterized protein n=1 Tax=Boeremia exigua TaxID=749465 RepID=UPI001E8D5DBB|nr:uncharacterized protein C7974DRAFT_417674 [Boeremia exigua]KAH6613929.1 hypothetical protein C7974DRAFT_417674 [Boeremia exigua]